MKVSEAVVTSYKKLIKQQDDTIAALSQELATLKASNGTHNQQNGILPQPVDNHILESQNNYIIESLKSELQAKEARCVELSDAFVWVEQTRAWVSLIKYAEVSVIPLSVSMINCKLKLFNFAIGFNNGKATKLDKYVSL